MPGRTLLPQAVAHLGPRLRRRAPLARLHSGGPKPRAPRGVRLPAAQHGAPDGAAADGVHEALAYRMQVYQAQGMVMVDLGVTLAEAMARLRGHAFASGRSVTDVARDVIAGKIVMDKVKEVDELSPSRNWPRSSSRPRTRWSTSSMSSSSCSSSPSARLG